MRIALRVLVAVLALVAGAAVGLAGVAVYAWWWGLLIAVVATVAGELALRPGPQRLAFAVGWVVPVGIAMVPRREGDFAIEKGVPGYTLMVLGAAVLLVASATLPIGRRNLRQAGARLEG